MAEGAKIMVQIQMNTHTCTYTHMLCTYICELATPSRYTSVCFLFLQSEVKPNFMGV